MALLAFIVALVVVNTILPVTECSWKPPVKQSTSTGVIGDLIEFAQNLRVIANAGVEMKSPFADPLTAKLGLDLKNPSGWSSCYEVVPLTEEKSIGISLSAVKHIKKLITKKIKTGEFVKDRVKDAMSDITALGTSKPSVDVDQDFRIELFSQKRLLVDKTHKTDPVIIEVKGARAKMSAEVSLTYLGKHTGSLYGGLDIEHYKTRKATREEINNYYNTIMNNTNVQLRLTLDPTSPNNCIYLQEHIAVGNPEISFEDGSQCKVNAFKKTEGKNKLPASNSFHHYHQRGYTRTFDLNPLLREQQWIDNSQKENRLDVKSIVIPIDLGLKVQGSTGSKHDQFIVSPVLPDYVHRTENLTESLIEKGIDLKEAIIDGNSTDLIIRFSSAWCPDQIHEYKVNKMLVLARSGEFLKKLIMADDKAKLIFEDSYQVVKIEGDFTDKAFEQVLDYMYTDVLPFGIDYKQVLLASMKLEVDSLTEKCLIEMANSMSYANVVDMLDFSRKNNLTFLNDIGLNFIREKGLMTDEKTFTGVLSEFAFLSCKA